MEKPGAKAVHPPPSTLQHTRRDLLAGGCSVLGGLGIGALTDENRTAYYTTINRPKAS